MMKYVLSALALKALSATPPTRSFYRMLGNQVGQRWRSHTGLKGHYVARARMFLEWCARYDAVRPGDRILEVGTGWVHWEATVLRLVYDAEVTLFDVWDNRQLQAYHTYCQALDGLVDDELGLSAEQAKRAHDMLGRVARCGSFDDIYGALGFRYLISPGGTLAHFPDQTFSLVVSANVMEHIDHDVLPDFVKQMYRVLRPGGYSMQWIDISDHLANFDPGVCRKHYLVYPNRTWKRYFENRIQYINRVQQPEWRELFEQAGFAPVHQAVIPTDISHLPIAPDFTHLSHEELACNTLQVVHRRAG
jgi:ubiquinone/menaquinone biosynthesis C-methylase UbiE